MQNKIDNFFIYINVILMGWAFQPALHSYLGFH